MGPRTRIAKNKWHSYKVQSCRYQSPMWSKEGATLPHPTNEPWAERKGGQAADQGVERLSWRGFMVGCVLGVRETCQCRGARDSRCRGVLALIVSVSRG